MDISCYKSVDNSTLIKGNIMNDVDAIINAAAKSSSTKKKKSDVPLTEVKGDVAKAVNKFSSLKHAVETAMAKLSQAEETIVPFARDFHAAEVKKKGALFSTVKLATKEHEIQVDVAKKQYSKINGECEEDLKERFGDDYNDFFEKKMSIKLTKKAMEDKEILAKLIKAVGKDKFSEYFDVGYDLVVKEKFHNDRFLSDDKRIQEVISEKVVKPNKVAIRG